MPKSWYIWSENIIKEDDPDDIIAKKKLYQNICAHKKPYFFQYNYSSLRSEYLNYKKQANENCLSFFGKTLDDLLFSESLSEDEKRFICTYKNKMNLDFSPSTMNRICWEIEKIFDTINWPQDSLFDYNILKSNIDYSIQDYSNIKKLCKNYQSDCMTAFKNKNKDDESEEVDVDQLLILLEQNINEIVPNQEIQCDILLDLCYKDGINKQVVWTICGDVIVKNLLNTHHNVMQYPKKCDSGEFWCGGNQFTMETFVYGGDINEEL